MLFVLTEMGEGNGAQHQTPSGSTARGAFRTLVDELLLLLLRRSVLPAIDGYAVDSLF